MNIFILDTYVKSCARYHTDKHVISQIKESVQMLATAHHVLGVNPHFSNKLAVLPAYVNHPCTKWARATLGNYYWLAYLAVNLSSEYTRRFGKTHVYDDLIQRLAFYPPPSLEEAHSDDDDLDELNSVPGQTFVLAMPSDCVVSSNSSKNGVSAEDAVKSYRAYYRKYKRHLFKWTKTPRPGWLNST